MAKKIGIISYSLALPGEKGYTRFTYLAQLLSENGYEVDLYTSTFNHMDKAQRNSNKVNSIVDDLNYAVYLAYEPGYKKNVDIRRIISHFILSKTIVKEIDKNNKKNKYDVLYCAIPDNALAANVSRYANRHSIPMIIDIEDLWPEGMEALLPIPKVIGKLIFSPFRYYAKIAYNNSCAYVGTSDEFRDEPLKYINIHDKPKMTVYVGCDLETFDDGVAKYKDDIAKKEDEYWVTYAGTLGSSYDIGTLIRAAQIISEEGEKHIGFKILGGGPLKEDFERMAAERPCNVEFVGYVTYPQMAAYLSKSDVTVNSFVKSAPQSIVNKVGDYLAAGKPMINTLTSPEFRYKVEHDGFGVNVIAEDEKLLAKVIRELYNSEEKCATFGINARRIAEKEFDRKNSYNKIVKLINDTIEKENY